MRSKVYQKDTSPNGDYLKCCIASLFGWREYYIPNFMDKGVNGWREAFVRYMASKNIGVISFPVADAAAFERFSFINRFSSFQCVVAVDSFRYKKQLHAVVGRVTNGVLEIVHDPNPQNAGKVTENYTVREVFVFFRSF